VKTCKVCLQTKEKTEFYANAGRTCKVCTRARSRAESNERYLKAKLNRTPEQLAAIKARSKSYYNKYKEKNAEKWLEWYKDPTNKQKTKQRSRAYYEKKADDIKAKTNDYYYNNRDRARKLQSEWKKNNREKLNLLHKENMQNDIQYRLRHLLRGRFTSALNKSLKGGSAVHDLGCSIHELKVYLERLFRPGMTWDNLGRYDKNRPTWHIDHIKPLSLFDLTDNEQVKLACHYTNLQPLWAEENLRKHDRYDGP